MDEMTQQNAALVEQAAVVAESLRDQGKKLSAVVSVSTGALMQAQAVPDKRKKDS